MSKDALGLRLIGGLCREKNLNILALKGIGINDLFDEARVGFKWVKDYVDSHEGSFPTAKMVEESIGNVIPDEDIPLEYLADNVRKRSLSNKLETVARRLAEGIEEREPDKAYLFMAEQAEKLRQSNTSSGSVLSYRKSSLSRFDSYKYAKENKGLMGIPTPWPKLTANIQGWMNGWLHVIAAMSGTGKSWSCCICAEHAERESKKRILFVTLEMEAARMARRIDAIRYKIPFGAIRDCSMDDLSESEWKSRLEMYHVEKGVCPECKGIGKSITPATVEGGEPTIIDPCPRCIGEGKIPEESDIIIADKLIVQTVADVVDLIKEHKPDIVFVDGGYRFEAAGGKGAMGNWEKTVNIVNDLQISAEKTPGRNGTSIPWIVTTQFGDSEESGKEKKRTKHVRAWNVRYGKEWYINPDVLIGLYADEDLRLTKAMEIWTLKMRDADKINPMFSIKWDLEKMDFGEESGIGMMAHSAAIDESPTSDSIIKF